MRGVNGTSGGSTVSDPRWFYSIGSLTHNKFYPNATLAEKRRRSGASKKVKLTNLSSTEWIQLVNSVSSVASTLVNRYRTYVGLSSPSKKEIKDDDRLARARQDLIDMCGVDAIQELDSELHADKVSNSEVSNDAVLSPWRRPQAKKELSVIFR